ncbi:MAG: dimethylsulfonioproprionate lyase family protein [Hyphomicrobiales bacterium]
MTKTAKNYDDGVAESAAHFIACARRLIGRLDRSVGGEAAARLALQPIDPRSAQPVEPRRLPACRYLPELTGELMAHDAALAAALAGLEDDLCWRQNANYSDEAMGQPGYMERYAHAEIVGPNGVFAGDDFLLGLMILGPGILYPDHFHPAPELYVMLAGDSAWSRDGGAFAPKRPGEGVWHPPGVVHATRTGASPLLTLYVWTKDVAEPARLVAR